MGPHTCTCLCLLLCTVCAFLCVHAQWSLVSVVAFSNQAELKGHCQMGIFQGQQNCENKRGPQKGPELLSYCEAELLDSLSWLDLEL